MHLYCFVHGCQLSPTTHSATWVLDSCFCAIQSNPNFYWHFCCSLPAEQAVREAATICPRPLWPWSFDLENAVRVTCDVGYLCAGGIITCLSMYKILQQTRLKTAWNLPVQLCSHPATSPGNFPHTRFELFLTMCSCACYKLKYWLIDCLITSAKEVMFSHVFLHLSVR